MKPSLASSSTQPLLSSSEAASTSSSSPSVLQNRNSQIHEIATQNGRVRKIERERRDRRRTIAKLRRMLPRDPELVQCSELELINRIMDYILSLQEILQSPKEAMDENRSPSLDVANLDSVFAQFHLSKSDRQPLRPNKQLCT